jgi:hypothetical protein
LCGDVELVRALPLRRSAILPPGCGVGLHADDTTPQLQSLASSTAVAPSAYQTLQLKFGWMPDPEGDQPMPDRQVTVIHGKLNMVKKTYTT